MARSLIASVLSLAAATALFGCSSGPSGEVKLGVNVSAIKAAVTTATNTTTGDPALVLTRVRVLVAHAKIGYIHEQSTGASADIGPVVVDLTADEIASGAKREFSLGSLPSDTYGGAEIEIEPLDGTESSTDAALDDFKTSGASVLVDGTYNGNAFSFAGHFLAEQGTDGDVVVDAATPVVLDLTVEPSGWFLDANGAAVDPGDTTQHDALAVAMCKTLDTQPQTDASAATDPAASGSSTSADGATGGKKHGGKGGGGGQGQHCVEAAGN